MASTAPPSRVRRARRMTLTLALACGSVAILAGAPPGPVRASPVLLISSAEAEQLRDIGIAPLSEGGITGVRARPAAQVVPLTERPARPAALALAAAAPIARPAVTMRLRGRVGDGLYESLLASGLSARAAGDYLAILSRQSGLGGDIGADDYFDLVIAAPTAPGEPIEGALLYAAINRAGASDVRVMKWPAAGKAVWVDAGATEQRAGTLGQPVAGRVSSGFGIRRHPILGFARSHRGVDIAARHGQPITAAADGQVTRSGWAGAYGRQVRIVHGGGVATSYSHMSRTAVGAGAQVRAGQIIGYVGSSGLSTGPHLHYEVHRGGVAVNPMGVRFAGAPRIQGGEADAFRARLAHYLAMMPVRPS